MEIISKTEGNKVTMGIAGWLDTQTSPELEEALSDLDERVTSLVFDFSKLEYISSAGLRIILKLQKMMNKIGTMKLIHVGEAILEIFEVTGFVDFLDIQ